MILPVVGLLIPVALASSARLAAFRSRSCSRMVAWLASRRLAGTAGMSAVSLRGLRWRASSAAAPSPTEGTRCGASIAGGTLGQTKMTAALAALLLSRGAMKTSLLPLLVFAALGAGSIAAGCASGRGRAASRPKRGFQTPLRKKSQRSVRPIRISGWKSKISAGESARRRSGRRTRRPASRLPTAPPPRVPAASMWRHPAADASSSGPPDQALGRV